MFLSAYFFFLCPSLAPTLSCLWVWQAATALLKACLSAKTFAPFYLIFLAFQFCGYRAIFSRFRFAFMIEAQLCDSVPSGRVLSCCLFFRLDFESEARGSRRKHNRYQCESDKLTDERHMQYRCLLSVHESSQEFVNQAHASYHRDSAPLYAANSGRGLRSQALR